jgi:hypothetical protein
MMADVEFTKQMIRLPSDVKSFLREQADFNCSSQNSEIVRAIRARMDAQKRGHNENV